MSGNVSIKETAKLMNKSEMFVRIGLQRGLLPIGTAIKTSSKYSYHISPKLLGDYLGINLNEEEICTREEINNKIE